MINGLYAFGIYVNILPFEVEKLFSRIIYSLNQDKLIQGITSYFSWA